jgi:excisionase family DNA binding protein
MQTAAREQTALREEQAAEAAAALRALGGLLSDELQSVELRTPAGEAVAVPVQAFQLFIEMLGHLASGDGVVVLPEYAELSTQQAADLLKVSRPYLVQLIDEHKLPARKVGTHRRVLLADLLAYKRRDDAHREAVMQELADEAQELGLGY